MQVECKFMEMYSPVFLAGSNLGTKLDVSKRSGLRLIYDRSEKELIILYKGEKAMFSSSAGYWVPSDPAAVEITVTEPKVKAKAPKTHTNHAQIADIGKAQVSTPHDHVFRK